MGDVKVVVDRRRAMLVQKLGPQPPEVIQSDLYYPTSDGTRLPARLYRPVSSPIGGCPLIVIFHGGGFCTGRLESEEGACRNFVQAYSVTCISAA